MTYDERSFFKLITCLARMLVTHVVSKKKISYLSLFYFPFGFYGRRSKGGGVGERDKR